jgi:polyferredoxin
MAWYFVKHGTTLPLLHSGEMRGSELSLSAPLLIRRSNRFLYFFAAFLLTALWIAGRSFFCFYFCGFDMMNVE